MSTPSRLRRAHFAPFALTTATALLLTACESGTEDGSDAQAAAKSQKIPTTDVVSSLRTDESAAKLLPAGTDSLALAVSVGGTPPGTSHLEDGKTLAGQDIDFAAAVAKPSASSSSARSRTSRRSSPRSTAASTTSASATSASPTSAAKPSTS